VQHQLRHHSILLLPAILAFACDPGEGATGLSIGGSQASSGSSGAADTSTSSAPGEPGDPDSTGTGTGMGTAGGSTTGDAAASTGAASTGAVGDETTGAASAGESGGEAPEGTTGAEPEGTTGAEPEGTTGDAPGGGEAPADEPKNVPDKDLLVALVGDMGAGSKPQSVYKRVLEEGADFVIILGDYDYVDSPTQWIKDIDAVLGESYPVFGVIGNHDVKAWKGYKPKLEERLAKIPGAVCTGDLGVASSCTYRGLHFVLSGVGTIGSKSDHEKYIASALAADDSPWSLCVWHKNQRDLQAGDKSDDVGWTAFKHCQKDGAIIVMGHEHSYARTRTLTDLGNKANGHGAVGMPELLEVGPGRTFTAVSGLGGKSIRAYDSKLHKADTWWATLYASNYHRQNGVEIQDVKADEGVLFMRFNVDGDPTAAHGYFKTVGGAVIDEFDVVYKK